MPAGKSILIKEGMISSYIKNYDIDHDGITDHYGFMIRNQILHPCSPIGCMRCFSIMVNDIEIDSNKAFFVLRGQWININKVSTIKEIFWNIGEEAMVLVQQQDGMKSGEYEVKCLITFTTLVESRIIDSRDIFPKRVEVLSSKLTVSDRVEEIC